MAKKERTTKKIAPIKRNCTNIDDPEFSRKPKEGCGFIYAYRFARSGKSYIGQTVTTVKRRLQSHMKRDSLVDRMILSGARFTIDILSEVPVDVLDDAERFCISYFNTIVPHGYNMTAGGQIFKRVLPGMGKAMSVIKKKQWENAEQTKKDKVISLLKSVRPGPKNMDIVCLETGKIYHNDPEACKDIGIHTGSVISVIKGRYLFTKGYHFALCNGYNEHNREEILSVFKEWERTKKSVAMRKSARRRYSNLKEHGEYFYRYDIRCLETGESFHGAGHVAKSMGLKMENVGQVCRGLKKTTGGYHFIYDTPYIADNCKEILDCLISWEKEIKAFGYRKKSR